MIVKELIYRNSPIVGPASSRSRADVRQHMRGQRCSSFPVRSLAANVTSRTTSPSIARLSDSSSMSAQRTSSSSSSLSGQTTSSSLRTGPPASSATATQRTSALPVSAGTDSISASMADSQRSQTSSVTTMTTRGKYTFRQLSLSIVACYHSC